ncbi:MAG: hypothetical protein GF381_04220, partial [Candidatus Pacebacteria bacterium]|nr:hypothetical protein [Candidatus Paceibacterota bacterium]
MTKNKSKQAGKNQAKQSTKSSSVNTTTKKTAIKSTKKAVENQTQSQKHNPKSDMIKKNNLAATRDGFGQAMLELGKTRSDIVALSADLTGSVRLNQFADKYPERFIQVGVAEQNLIGVAAGLALGGKTAFAASFAAFSPGRTFDQIRVSVAYSNLPVIIVGAHAGLATGPDGATHQMMEDLAMMRALPRMVVIQPCDAQQAYQATLALAKLKQPAYLRLSRPKVETITKPSNSFEIGKAQILKQGVDLTIIASGITVQIAWEAVNKLTSQGLSVRLINVHTLKPLDEQKIIDAAKETKAIITIEDHQVIGGLGSSVAQV